MKPGSNEQVRKLFDLSKLRSAESKTNPAQLKRTTRLLSGSLLRINDSQRQQFRTCEKHINKLSVF